MVKNPHAIQETWVQSPGGEDSLEKGKATQYNMTDIPRIMPPSISSPSQVLLESYQKLLSKRKTFQYWTVRISAQRSFLFCEVNENYFSVACQTYLTSWDCHSRKWNPYRGFSKMSRWVDLGQSHLHSEKAQFSRVWSWVFLC